MQPRTYENIINELLSGPKSGQYLKDRTGEGALHRIHQLRDSGYDIVNKSKLYYLNYIPEHDKDKLMLKPGARLTVET
tara:strand:+ start:315 stop:548 length:234 start_codon:yes stop_codon:yes gene_type:complete